MASTERFKFNLDARFYEELHDRLESLRRQESEAISAMCKRVRWPLMRLGQDRLAPKVIPTAKILRVLVETAFWASLLREEGRELRFAIKYVRRLSDELPFKEPIDFDVSSLRKLAPALGRVDVGISLSGDGHLKIAELSNLITEPLAIKVLDPGLVWIRGTLRLSQGTGPHLSARHC